MLKWLLIKFENKILTSFRATWAILPWSIVALCWIRVLHIIKKLKVSVLSYFLTKFWLLYIMNDVFYTLNIMAFIYNVWWLLYIGFLFCSFIYWLFYVYFYNTKSKKWLISILMWESVTMTNPVKIWSDNQSRSEIPAYLVVYVLRIVKM